MTHLYIKPILVINAQAFPFRQQPQNPITLLGRDGLHHLNAGLLVWVKFDVDFKLPLNGCLKDLVLLLDRTVRPVGLPSGVITLT